jgi:ubiquinone/menaquinone biosynthesis C-methylase UbiE
LEILSLDLMQQNKEVISQWSDSAPYWEKHRAVIREMFMPVTQALIEDMGISTGSAVLDVATGPGEPSLTIAGLVVGLGGKVVGTDIVPEMVEAARREALRLQLQNAQFEVADTSSLPFPAETFDAAVSRFGVMFFPSPIDCLRDILRVLKPGGRIALAVWHFAERNPFHCAVSQIVDRYFDSPPLDSDAPDAFRFAQPGKLLHILSNAGATSTSERLLQFSIRARISVEDFWTLRSEMSDKFRTKLALLSPPRLAALRGEVIQAIRAYSSKEEICFPAEVLIVSGRKESAK